MVDEGIIKFNPAVELSFLKKKEQENFLEAMCAVMDEHRKVGCFYVFFEYFCRNCQKYSMKIDFYV